MVIIIIIAFNLLLTMLIINELITLSCYGKLIPKEKHFKYMNLNTTQLRFNIFSDDILQNENIVISKVLASILIKYYISGVGTVLRFSKLHKKIDEYYKIAESSK